MSADPPVPGPPSYDELARRVRELTEANKAQQDVITTLVSVAEDHAATLTARLGTQTLVEQRTARLHNAERLLRSVIEDLDGALCIVGADGTVLDANRRWPGPVGGDFFTWCQTTPHLHDLLEQAADLVRAAIDVSRPSSPASAASTMPPNPRSGSDPVDGRAPQEPPLALRLRDGAEPPSVKGQIGPDDNRRWVVLRVHPIHDHDYARVVVTLLDITEGMRTQEQLRRATDEAQRLALVARATDNAVVITDPAGRIEWVNDRFVMRTGITLQQAIGHTRAEFVDDACRESPEFQDLLARLDRGLGTDGDFPMLSRTGLPYWAGVEVRPVKSGERITHLVWVEKDITARRRTEQRLREAMTRGAELAAALTQEKTLLSGVISAIPQMIYWKDAAGRYAGCNSAFRALCVPDAIPGSAELSLPKAMAETLSHLEVVVTSTGTAILDRAVDLVDQEGRLRTLLLSVLPFDLGAGGQGSYGVIGVGADITHVRELERQFAHANRLESIGQLAAGIAHEINTPVQFVSDNMQFIGESVQELLGTVRTHHGTAGCEGFTDTLDLDFLLEELPAAVRDSREGLSRVTQIVRAMKDFSHPGTNRSDVDINRAIESTVYVCRNEWKYVAQVDLDLDPAMGLIPAYEGDLKQVILNMVVNAAQAIGASPDRPGLGHITVTTRREPNECLVIIADDGPGMTPMVRDRAFDPFFTTKEVGKGTGQGLSLAHAIVVTKHGGRIDLDTTPGQGSRFTLHLPLSPPGGSPAEDPDHSE